MSHKSTSSPYINHFLQPDTIIPDYTNPQAFNRYSYVANSPINLNDPTGHCSSRGDDWCFENSALSKGKSKGGDSDANDRQTGRNNALIESIKEKYKWNLGNDTWTYDELSGIYQAGSHIESYVNGITSGKGLEWILAYMGGTSFEHGEFPGTNYSYVSGSTVHVSNSWQGGDHDGWEAWPHIVHELSHIVDNRSGMVLGCDATICGGGMADIFILSMTGHIPLWPRFANGSSGVPLEYQWKKYTYGNNGTAEYFAESFKYAVSGDPNNIVPKPDVLTTMQSLISGTASMLP